MDLEKTNKIIFDFDAVFEPDDYLYFYEDRISEEQTKKEIDFLIKELELQKSTKILDLACGHGRHTNKLAELGYNITGVDINKGFLEIAKNDARKKKLNTKFICGDMRKIEFKEEFDRLLLLFTSFGYFEDEENFKVIKNVANALVQGGLFCFDTFNRDVFLKNFLPYIVIEKGDDLMIDRKTFDSFTGRIYDKRIVIRNGRRKDKPFFIRIYNPNEIKELLSKAGLNIHNIYEGWDGKPFTSNSRTMIIIAKKE